jgi:hypothetical protein
LREAEGVATAAGSELGTGHRPCLVALPKGRIHGVATSRCPKIASISLPTAATLQTCAPGGIRTPDLLTRSPKPAEALALPYLVLNRGFGTAPFGLKCG